MITLLSNVAIGDTSNLSNIVYLNNIMEGVDGAATFGYSLEPSAVKVDDNQTQQYLHDHTLDIRVLQGAASDLTKLKVIDANQTPVLVSGHSPDGFFVIDDPAQLTYHSQYDSVIADRVLVTTTGVNGYGGAAPGTKVPVYAGDNLLAIYKVNSGSATFLNGMDANQPTPGTVSGDTVTVGNGDTVASRDLFFPFPGLSITTSITQTGSGTGTLVLLFKEADKSSISASTTALTSGTTTLTATLPALTGYVAMSIIATSALSLKNPMIRLQGSSFSL